MNISTTGPTEAQLEARINETLRRVFPGVTDLRHQLRFTVKFGKNELTSEISVAEGRADILLYQNNTPLAVIELKREGLALTADDEEQGRSYALLSKAPLYVLTNGSDTRVFTTHDGQRLTGATLDAAQVLSRIQSAALAAQVDVKKAIEKLLGTDFATDALRKMSRFEIAEHTGGWSSESRFIEGFSVARFGTAQAARLLEEMDKSIVIVTGAPLSGKSNVLRELGDWDFDIPTDVVYIDGEGCPEGLFRRLANLLGEQFDWPATVDESRQWLRKVANRVGRNLVLCVDSYTSEFLRSDLEELLGEGYGSQLKIVLSADQNDVPTIRHSANRREYSKIGKQSEVVVVGNYSNDEFMAAENLVRSHGGRFVHGAQESSELRVPWVMRAVVSARLSDKPADLVAVLPPIVGRELVQIAQDRFSLLGDLRDYLKKIAEVYVDELLTQSPEDVLAGLYVYAVKQDSLRKKLDRQDIEELMRGGLIRKGHSQSEEPIFIISAPELFASLVASYVSAELTKRFAIDQDATEAWFVKTCSHMPLGDVVGAQALGLLYENGHEETFAELLERLRLKPPEKRPMPAGSRVAIFLDALGTLDFVIEADGRVVEQNPNRGREPIVLDAEDEPFQTISDLDAWLILGQLRIAGVEVVGEDGTEFDYMPALLMELGKCPMVLRRVDKPLMGQHLHEVNGATVSCQRDGIVEPVTWWLAEMLSNLPNQKTREEWVLAALKSGDFPLINRVGQALTHLSKLYGLKEWAEHMLNEHHQPAFEAFPAFH